MGSKSRSRSSSANSDKGDSDSANRNSRIRRSTKNNLTTLFSCVLLGSSSFLTSFPPGAAAQELVTTNLFPDIPLPTVSSIPPLPVPSQPPLPPPVQPVQPVSLLPNGTSSSSSGQNQPSSSSTSTSPISVYTLVAELPSPTPSLSPVLAGTPFTFPSPLPDGIARTASGKPIPCSPKNVHLNPTTHKLISECTETAFCAQPPDAPANATGLGMCFARRCTRDEFPFGYGTFGGGIGRKKNSTTAGIPPMCPKGTFCPDNGSGCMPPIEIGGRCELARDEQCAPPPPNPNVKPQDNKSICLNNYCFAATQQLGQPCQVENTTYVSDIIKGAAGGGQFTSYVIKHNCQAPGLFCEPTAASQYPDSIGQGTCQKAKELAGQCKFDAECISNNCAAPANTCIPNVEQAYKIQPWQWFATVLFIVILLVSGMIGLAFIHRRHRYARFQELQEYYHEQMSLRRSILALHAAAAAEKPPGNTTEMFAAKHKEAGRF